jgi:DNA repair protein RecO (recombination protein O)
MLEKTRGIVINHIKFRETSVITKIYTEVFGLQTYIENGVRSSKGKNKMAHFQPLTLLDLVVYYNDNQTIKRLSEIRCNTPFQTLPYEFYKTTIGIFLAEILNKVIKEESGNSVLFEFLFASLSWLDASPDNYENFHIQFLLKLARYLGFDPQSGKNIFVQIGRLAPDDNEEIIGLDFFIQNPYDKYLKIGSLLRRDMLETILRFYAFQIENFGEVKSLTVLREIMM